MQTTYRYATIISENNRYTVRTSLMDVTFKTLGKAKKYIDYLMEIK